MKTKNIKCMTLLKSILSKCVGRFTTFGIFNTNITVLNITCLVDTTLKKFYNEFLFKLSFLFYCSFITYRVLNIERKQKFFC